MSVNKSSKSQVSTTVRMSQSQNEFIELLMEKMAMSKQKVMTLLLEEGSKAIEKSLEMNIEESFSDCPFYIFCLDRNDKKMFLDERLIASKEKPWKNFIENIKADSVIFLYSEGAGIIAYGKACEQYSSIQDYTYRELSGFKNLELPILLPELKKLTGLNFVPNKTIQPLTEGSKILDFINTSSHTCPKCNKKAEGLSEIYKLFGVRQTARGISHQSWCRACRQG